MVQLEQARTRAKAANKLALDAEKEKDDAEQEVQSLQQLLQVKRTRTHATTANDHEECDKKSSDDMDLADQSTAAGARHVHWCAGVGMAVCHKSGRRTLTHHGHLWLC